VLAFVLVMNGYPDPRTGLPRGMPVPVLIMLAVTAVMMWVVRSTRFGRYVFAYGGNPEAPDWRASTPSASPSWCSR